MTKTVRIFIAMVAMITVAVATLLILRFAAKVPYESWAYQLIGTPLAVLATFVALYLTRPETENWSVFVDRRNLVPLVCIALGVAGGFIISWAIMWAIGNS